MNECYDCDCYDSDSEGCTMPSIDKWYACPIESALPENQEELKKMAEWYGEKKGVNMDEVICEIRCDEGIRFFENDLCGTLRTISACGDKHVIQADRIVNKGGRDRMIDGNVRIRKLTPTECFKLQGFTAEDSKKAADAGVSNSQLYKQAGNSICVSVLEAIYRSLGDRYEEFKPLS